MSSSDATAGLAAAAGMATSPATLTCPYCASNIAAAALVCPHCTRDLYLFKPLLEQAQRQEQQLQGALARIAALEAGLASAHSASTAAATGPEHAAGKAAGRSSGSGTSARRKPEPKLWRSALALVALLMCLHTVILLVLDLPPIWLRLACVALPIPFGYWAARPRGKSRSLVRLTLAAVTVAVCAPLGMAAVMMVIEHKPILPGTMLEYQEFMSFMLSIALSMGTGMIIGRHLGSPERHPAAEEMSKTYGRVSQFIHRLSPELVQKNFEGIQKAMLALIAVATTAASMVSGLKDVVGTARTPEARPAQASPAGNSGVAPAATPKAALDAPATRPRGSAPLDLMPPEAAAPKKKSP
jgi:hypothetical protein